jgi:phenylacetate-CoA ligase
VAVNDVDLVSRLNEFRPTHLTAYASILNEIARQIEMGQLSLKPELEQVINISERLLPQTRKRYEEIFGAPVIDDYGVGECLFLSNGCPTSNGMHVNADWAILEVVDENNCPVPAGESGAKVLVTNLANNVQPIIRYEIGDIVTMATKQCGCGSNMPLIERIDGRESEMFYVDASDGKRAISPLMFEFAVSQILDAREYQIVQEEANRFRILIEPLPELIFDREHANYVLQTHLNACDLDDWVQVEVEVVDRLASDGNAKFKRVISKVGELAALN